MPSAPLEVVLEWIGSRTNNPYGKTPAERAAILANFAEVEPLLRRTADVEITTDKSLGEVVEVLLERVRNLTG